MDVSLFCNECGDQTYCEYCCVSLFCFCVQKKCMRYCWIERHISWSNDECNCWCTDCHQDICWNGLSFKCI